jgi:hypothetical protein
MSEGEICAIVMASTMGMFMLCGVLYWRNPCNHKGHDYEKVGESYREETFVPNKDRTDAKGYKMTKVYEVLLCKRCKHVKMSATTSSHVDF